MRGDCTFKTNFDRNLKIQIESWQIKDCETRPYANNQERTHKVSADGLR